MLASSVRTCDGLDVVLARWFIAFEASQRVAWLRYMATAGNNLVCVWDCTIRVCLRVFGGFIQVYRDWGHNHNSRQPYSMPKPGLVDYVADGEFCRHYFQLVVPPAVVISRGSSSRTRSDNRFRNRGRLSRWCSGASLPTTICLEPSLLPKITLLSDSSDIVAGAVDPPPPHQGAKQPKHFRPMLFLRLLPPLTKHYANSKSSTECGDKL